MTPSSEESYTGIPEALGLLVGIVLSLIGLAAIVPTIWLTGDNFSKNILAQIVNQIGQAFLIAGLLDLALSSGLRVFVRWLENDDRRWDAWLTRAKDNLEDVQRAVVEAKLDSIIFRLDRVSREVEGVRPDLAEIKQETRDIFGTVNPEVAEFRRKVEEAFEEFKRNRSASFGVQPSLTTAGVEKAANPL